MLPRLICILTVPSQNGSKRFARKPNTHGKDSTTLRILLHPWSHRLSMVPSSFSILSQMWPWCVFIHSISREHSQTLSRNTSTMRRSYSMQWNSFQLVLWRSTVFFSIATTTTLMSSTAASSWRSMSRYLQNLPYH